MMVTTVEILELIKQEEDKISQIISPSESINKISNLIKLKFEYNDNRNIYIYIKLLIEKYIEVIKYSDYGYDTFNYIKLEQVLYYISLSQRVSILKYTISRIANELPDFEKDWFINQKNIAEISLIKQNFKKNPKVFRLIALYAGKNTYYTLISILIVFLIPVIVLLPAPIPQLIWFEISYNNYSDVYFVNHILNLLGFFADIDNDFNIEPQNALASFFFIFYKIIFIILIANFLYTKITDKIIS